MKRKITLAIAFLSLIAIIITSYLVMIHYNPAESSPCAISQKIDCSKVNSSDYSELFHLIGAESIYLYLGFDIPIALIGLLTYIALLILSVIIYKKTYIEQESLVKKYVYYIFVLALIGFLFSAYLTYIEAFVLGTWCLFCVMQAIIITLILISSIILLSRNDSRFLS